MFKVRQGILQGGIGCVCVIVDLVLNHMQRRLSL